MLRRRTLRRWAAIYLAYGLARWALEALGLWGLGPAPGEAARWGPVAVVALLLAHAVTLARVERSLAAAPCPACWGSGVERYVGSVERCSLCKGRG